MLIGRSGGEEGRGWIYLGGETRAGPVLVGPDITDFYFQGGSSRKNRHPGGRGHCSLATLASSG